MPSNPFKRSKSPAEQTRDRLDKARRAVAEMARGVSVGADTLASALDDSQDRRSAPRFAIGAAALLGAAYVGAKKLGVTSAVAKQIADVRSGVTESAGGATDAAESASPPPAAAAAESASLPPAAAAGAPASG
jgi:hypothetical protein